MRSDTLTKILLGLIAAALVAHLLVRLPLHPEATAQPIPPDHERWMKMSLEMLKVFLEDKDLPIQLAAFNKKLYDAYRKQGFSPEQALQLVAHTNWMLGGR